MKQFYSLFPAFLFSSSILVFISNNQPYSASESDSRPAAASEGFNAGKGRLAYEMNRLRDPQTGKIPSNIRKLELEYASSLPGYKDQGQNATEKIESLTWQSRGPWNVGGRTRAFAIDATNPNKFLAGSAAGGMWTSTDAGATWAPNWSAVHQSVSCIAQDTRPGKTNTWYIGTGEGYGQSASGNGTNAYYLGNGMYKSTDGGQTWSSLTATAPTTILFNSVWQIIWNVATNPADTVNNVVYAAAYNAIYKSINGGTTWSLAKGTAINGPYSYFSDVAVSPTGVVYATLSSDGHAAHKGIWRSTDGTTWNSITPPGFPPTYGRVKIGISPADENQVYFFVGTTNNFGTPDTNFLGDVEWNSLWKYQHDSVPEWFDISANLPTTGGPFDKQTVQGGYDMVIKLHPTDTNIVFLGGTNLYRSTDGFKSPNNTTFIGGYQQGTTLPIVNSYLNHHPDQHEIAFHPSNAGEMYSINDGGIFKTSNNAASTVAWTPLNNGYLTSMFYTVALDHASTNDSTLVGGAQDNGSWFVNSNNPQSSWVTPRGGDGSYCAIANNKLSYYFSIQNGKMMQAILNSSGVVQTYSRIDPIGGKNYQFINPFTLDPSNMNRMYLAGGKNLWRNDSLNAIYAQHINNWDSINTGWTMFPDTLPIPWITVNGVLTGAEITALAVSKNPANVVYYGTSNRRIYRVDNAHTGTPAAVDISWIASTPNGFPIGGSISAIAIDPADAGNVMVAFSNYNVYSIFYSTNADSSTVTWTKVAGNLEANSSGGGNGPSVRWVSIMPVSDGIVYLAATSTGLYATDTLKGTSTVWVQQGASTIGNSICDMIDFRTTDGLVAVATHSHGIFTSHILSVNDLLSVHDLTSAPNLQLSNFPNPFTSSTTLCFSLLKTEKVQLTVYDINGKLIQTLASKVYPAGEHKIDFSGAALSQGIYYCHLQTGEAVTTKKILLIK
jgi:hypothetical protein